MIACGDALTKRPAATPALQAPVVDSHTGATCGEASAVAESERHRESERAREDLGPEEGGWETRLRQSGDVCGVADSNLAKLQKAILASPAPEPGKDSTTPWNHHTSPKYMDVVDRRLHLSPPERALLFKNGFVVPARLEQESYGWAMHDIFQSQLPLYVSMDSLFHAIFAANDSLILKVEQERLAPVLKDALVSMRCALPAAAVDYPREVAEDLDLYLAVAYSLLGVGEPKPVLGPNPQVDAIVKLAEEASGFAGDPNGDGKPFVLFGRPRMVDFSMYQPRGHYVGNPKDGGDTKAGFSIDRYFKSSMWLSRLEFNVSSRSCRSSHPSTGPDPSETPREATVALALSDLAERSGALPLIESLDRAWGLFAERREDLSLSDVVKLRKKANITSIKDPKAPALLRAAIGNDFRRRARTHFMPQGTTELPAIVSILGARVGNDARGTRPLVHDAIAGRFLLGAADMGFALGHDRAIAHLAKEIRDFPTLPAQLAKSRAIVNEPLETSDMYNAWFGAVRSLAAKPTGTLPSFMRTETFADMRLNSAIAGYGQIRHNYVLMSAQTYDAYGCEIPDGFVEPAPEALDALIAYATRGATLIRDVDPKDVSDGRAYFQRLEHVLRVLRRIVATELSGAPLTEDQKRFLGMVAEYIPQPDGCDSCPPPRYTGWWFDLFAERVGDGLSAGDFIADYYASTNTGQVAYIGATRPRLGLFVVDTSGRPRVMVGPVARAYEYVGSIDKRLSDEDARKLTNVSDPWAASYTAAAAPEPPLSVRYRNKNEPSRNPYDKTKPLPPDVTVTAVSTKALGPVTIELLDHHRVPVASQTKPIGTKEVIFHFTGKFPHPEGLHVKVGDFSIVSTRTRNRTYGYDLELGAMRAP